MKREASDLLFDETDEVLRWSCRTQPFPLPEHSAPANPEIWDGLTDDQILDLPPHVVVHIQRTVAQGGMQVISPRQTPMSQLMARVAGSHKELGDHVVGSIAEASNAWPTIDGRSLDSLLPDEPLPSAVNEEDNVARTKTRTEPLTSAGKLLKDPVLSCLVKGRATIDVLRRSDVMGGAEELAAVIGSAWGLTGKQVMEMDALTLGVEGPLLRHAIMPDAVFPVVHAPVHIRKTVSVGASDVSRMYLPDDTAMDWRRLRVFAEAVFVMCCQVEGLPIKHMRVSPPPGDPTARLDRPGVISFRPLPCTAWTFTGSTFSITPSKEVKSIGFGGVPKEVLEAMTKYAKIVCPVSHVLNADINPKLVRTTLVTPHLPSGETLLSSFMYAARLATTMGSRGKTAAATVRNTIFAALEAAAPDVRARIARYMRLAKEECLAHLGLSEVPDIVVDKLAIRFLEIGGTIRLKIASEAARRGDTTGEWWEDICAQVPTRYRILPEGTTSWAKVGIWLCFKQPTDNWRKLTTAVHHSALRDAAKKAHRGVALPAGLGTPERMEAACRATVKAIAKAHAGYYSGAADVGMAIAEYMDEEGRERSACVMREAAFLWVLRSRCLRGTNIALLPKQAKKRSPNHYMVEGRTASVSLVPCPYVAFKAYQGHVENSEVLGPWYKRLIEEYDHTKSRVSEVFSSISRCILPCKETVVTRYLLRPNKLSSDMEKGWRLLVDDIREVVAVMDDEMTVKHEASKKAKVSEAITETNLQDVKPVQPIVRATGKGYFEVTADLEYDIVEGIEDSIKGLPDIMQDVVYEGSYQGVEDLMEAIARMAGEWDEVIASTGEAVH